MARITRQLFKLFGSSGASSNFGAFGSKVAGNPTNTKDISAIQSFGAWLNGLQDAVFGAQKAPFLEEFNALFYVFAYQLAYILQEGLASEWNTNTTYYTTSIVKNGTDLYKSAINDNLGNALPNKTSNANWTYLGDLATLVSASASPVGAIADFGGSVAPSGWLVCDGTAVSRVQYAALFSAIGVNWGPGDGVSTFNLPNLTRRTTVGSGGSGTSVLGNSVGNVGGEESHTLSIAEMPSHNHDMSVGVHSHTSFQGHHFLGYAAGQGARGTAAGSDAFFDDPQTNEVTVAVTAQLKGGGTAHNIMQPSAVVLKIIKY